MARQIPEIYDQLIEEKENQAVLSGLLPIGDSFDQLADDLNSTSLVALWRLMLAIVAVGIFVLEVLFDLFKVEIEAIAAAAIPGTPAWFKDRALEFQFGDNLLFIDNKFQYQEINEAIQIIDFAAITEAGGQVKIKVAKEDGNGDPEPLTTVEFDAFKDYMSTVSPAGVNKSFQSNNADLLRLFYEIFFDPQVLNPNGSLISDASVFPVEDAINGHLKVLPFNGELSLSAVTDAIQLADGVEDLVNTDAQSQFGALPFTSFTVSDLPNAGYYKIDPANLLPTTIIYTPNV